MSMVNPGLLQFSHMKDSRWLTLEVCREFQRSKCSRTELDCKFAHPPPHVEVQNGRVVCCYDSIKGKCQRKEPPCKYLHPPQHLREQLLQNGRNNLIIKNIQMQMLSQSLAASGQLLPITAPFMGGAMQTQALAAPSYPGYHLSAGAAGLHLLSAADAALIGAAPPPPPSAQQQQQQQQTSHSQAGIHVSMSNGGGGGVGSSVSGKMDSRESCFTSNSMVAAAATAMQTEESGGSKKRKLAELNEDQQFQHQQQQHAQIMFPMCLQSAGGIPNGCYPGTLPGGKRAAVADAKSGIPVYQPSAASYQQLAAFHQVPSPQSHSAGAFIPTSWTGDLFQEAACPTLTWV